MSYILVSGCFERLSTVGVASVAPAIIWLKLSPTCVSSYLQKKGGTIVVAFATCRCAGARPHL